MPRVGLENTLASFNNKFITKKAAKVMRRTGYNRLSNKEEPMSAVDMMQLGRQATLAFMMAKKRTVCKASSMVNLS